MSEVQINGGGHQVIVRHDGGDLAYVVEKAQKLWQETRGEPQPLTAGVGFTTQIRPQWGHDRQQGRQWQPVRAEGDEDG